MKPKKLEILRAAPQNKRSSKKGPANLSNLVRERVGPIENESCDINDECLDERKIIEEKVLASVFIETATNGNVFSQNLEIKNL